MIKYNIVMCWYDRILINVAAFVVPGKFVRGALVRIKRKKDIGLSLCVLILQIIRTVSCFEFKNGHL